MKIVSARITPMPKSMFGAMPEVWVKLEGQQEEQKVFEFYPDEIMFSAKEFIVLTIEEARHLKFKKDKDYLQS